MEMEIQPIPNGKCLESNTIHVLKDFNPQSLAIQAEKRKQVASMMPFITKKFLFDG